ncbi:hypothetical protein NTE_00437 [Candidatus Nitrososphaera evergladensis SR1]|uniref:Uncharacterized protein n=1 Tax=Candidatus Nitrososphaera evergladensis SR1 TaxID=1459636 RepID=A0A075MT74_9ARCH|nr:hypothetical protein NTE_00437 [Candidatus Nitrososphaera evergladensis SR1]
MSIVNLCSLQYYVVIEMIEAIGYVAMGFIATFAAMEAAWRIAKRDAPALQAAAAARVK